MRPATSFNERIYVSPINGNLSRSSTHMQNTRILRAWQKKNTPICRPLKHGGFEVAALLYYMDCGGHKWGVRRTRQPNECLCWRFEAKVEKRTAMVSILQKKLSEAEVQSDAVGRSRAKRRNGATPSGLAVWSRPNIQSYCRWTSSVNLQGLMWTLAAGGLHTSTCFGMLRATYPNLRQVMINIPQHTCHPKPAELVFVPHWQEFCFVFTCLEWFRISHLQDH